MSIDPKGKKMVRNLKPLGFALVAVFALSAALASVASAQTQGKFTADGRIGITGTQIESETNSFEAFGAAPIKCPGSTYAGTKVGSTELLESGETTTTITPNYVNCEFEGSKEVSVDMNGCDYVLHVGNTISEAEGTFGATADIVCPGGNRIRVTKPGCDIEVGAQTGLTGTMQFKHTTGTADDIDLSGKFTNIHATTEAACLDLSTTVAVTNAHMTIKCHGPQGVDTPCTITR